MKKKKINTKLTLGKATIVNLNDSEMNKINGGSSWLCFGAAVNRSEIPYYAYTCPL